MATVPLSSCSVQICVHIDCGGNVNLQILQFLSIDTADFHDPMAIAMITIDIDPFDRNRSR